MMSSILCFPTRQLLWVGVFFFLRVSCGRVFFCFFSLLWFKGASCGWVFCCCGLRASCRGVVFLFFGCGLRASMMHK